MARPPLLPDATILSLIAELRGQQAVLTGMHLRAELTRRHGYRGGVTRVYRLLNEETGPVPPPAPPAPIAPHADADLRSQLAAATERARLAEHREEHHQARWAGEIHALREQVRSLNDASYRLKIAEGELRDRSRELTSAFLRIAELESRLIALTDR